MKRIAFVAAAALLGTGCISSTTTPPPPGGDVALYWQFRDYDGNVSGASGAGTGCGVAGVTEVGVDIWRGATLVVSENVPCAQVGTAGVAYTLPVGTYSYALTGYRGPDAVFASSERSIEAMQGMLMEDDATLDVVSTTLPLTIYYQMNGAYTCAGVNNVYFRILTGNQATVVANDQVACDPSAYGFTLPYDEQVGSYYFEWLQARTATPTAVYELCGFTRRHTGFPIVVNLFPAPDASCPL